MSVFDLAPANRQRSGFSSILRSFSRAADTPTGRSFAMLSAIGLVVGSMFMSAGDGASTRPSAVQISTPCVDPKLSGIGYVIACSGSGLDYFSGDAMLRGEFGRQLAAMHDLNRAFAANAMDWQPYINGMQRNVRHIADNIRGLHGEMPEVVREYAHLIDRLAGGDRNARYTAALCGTGSDAAPLRKGLGI